MKRFIERVVRSTGSPDTNDLWLNDKLVLKVYENEEWKPIAGGSGGGGGEGGGCDCDPVEANPAIEEGTQTTPLEALKVGDNVYSVQGCNCLPPVIVNCSYDIGNSLIIPSLGAPPLREVYEHMRNGGLVYFVGDDPYQNEPPMKFQMLAGYLWYNDEFGYVEIYTADNQFVWRGAAASEINVRGNFDSNSMEFFEELNSPVGLDGAYMFFSEGVNVYLVGQVDGAGPEIRELVVSAEDHYIEDADEMLVEFLTTENGYSWYPGLA